MPLTGFDWVFIAIFGLCVLLGLQRGLIREGLGLLVWAVAILAGNWYCALLAPHLPDMMNSEELRIIVAFVLIVIAGVIIGGIVTRFINTMIQWAGMSGFNRLLGGAFGALKGGAILAVIGVAVPLTPFAQMSGWQQSQLRPMISQLQDSIVGQYHHFNTGRLSEQTSSLLDNARRTGAETLQRVEDNVRK